LFCANDGGHFAPGAIHRGASLLPKTVDTGCVSERLDNRARHCLRDAWIDGRRRAVVKINSANAHENQLRLPPTQTRYGGI
jgi:hypothetical protein